MDESVKNIPRSGTSFSDIRYNDPWLRFDDGDHKSDIPSIAVSTLRLIMAVEKFVSKLSPIKDH